ncbi:MAG: hypothetical protein EPN94_05045 [Nitrospirae bacterium]|nr:MAG: hypothetical protein EPN94_05045 [Nitrospirota bacterium]
MKKYMLVIILSLVFYSCSPAYTYRSKVESLQEYKDNLIIKESSEKDININYWTAVKKEFPDYAAVIDTIMLVGNDIADMKEKDMITIDDKIAYNKMVSDFWNKLKSDVDIKQQEFNASLILLSNSLNAASQSLNAAQQQRYSQSHYNQPYRAPINCTSYRIGNVIRTTCY